MARSNVSVIYPKLYATRGLQRREEIKGAGVSGFRWLPDGIEQVSYEVAIDLAAVEALAGKAAGNKSGRAKAGPVYVRILSRRKVSA